MNVCLSYFNIAQVVADKEFFPSYALCYASIAGHGVVYLFIYFWLSKEFIFDNILRLLGAK